MIEMNNWATQAVSKLNEGRNEIPVFNADDVSKKLRDSKLTQKQKDEVMAQARVSVVADRARETLCNLCRLDVHFAQTVIEGGSLGDCLKKALEGINYEISDLELVKKCAAFYFPAAKVEMELRIDTAGAQESKQVSASSQVLHFNLDDFLL